MGNKVVKYDGDDNPSRFLYTTYKKMTQIEYERWYGKQVDQYCYEVPTHYYLTGPRIVFKYKKVVENIDDPLTTIYAGCRFKYPAIINSEVNYPKVTLNKLEKTLTIYNNTDKPFFQLYFIKDENPHPNGYYTILMTRKIIC